LLTFVGQPGTNDSNEVVFWFRVDDDHEAAINWTNGDEAILEFRVRCVEDLEIVCAELEESLSLRERQTMLSLIAEVLSIIPLETHIDRE
jgi:hypothetical protein